MTTIADFQFAIDAEVTAQLVNGAPPIPVVRPNMTDVTVAGGSVPWVKMQIPITSQVQLQLGDVHRSRNWGSLIFAIHVPKNTGNAQTNIITNRILRTFRSKRIGGVTFLKSLLPFTAEVGNWSVTGITIPFYFDDMSS